MNRLAIALAATLMLALVLLVVMLWRYQGVVSEATANVNVIAERSERKLDQMSSQLDDATKRVGQLEQRLVTVERAVAPATWYCGDNCYRTEGRCLDSRPSTTCVADTVAYCPISVLLMNVDTRSLVCKRTIEDCVLATETVEGKGRHYPCIGVL